MNSDDQIQAAKEKVSILDLWRILKLEGTPNPPRLISAPWRSDKTPSLSIFSQGRAFKDHGEGSGGDAICFLEKALGLSRKDAVITFLEIAGLSKNDKFDRISAKKFSAPVETLKQRDRPELPVRSKGNAELHRELADLRNVSLSAVTRMVEKELLFFCEYQGSQCWLITDNEGVNAQVRKLNGEKFGEYKAKTLFGSWAKWPIGVGQAGDKILLVEGSPDFLAAHDEILNPDWSPVCMFGAQLGIHPGAIPLFFGKEVCIVPHNDKAGRDAFENWSSQLKGVAKKVWSRNLPAEVGDLNDWVSLERKAV